MSFLFRKRGRGIPPNAAFRLTQEGREKLQEFTGDSNSQVLTALETRGSSNIRELRQATGLSKGRVESCVLELASGGFIQPVGPLSTVEGD